MIHSMYFITAPREGRSSRSASFLRCSSILFSASLDNEPGLWSFDHWDVHPAGTSYDEVWEKISELGALIRAKEPAAVITSGAVGGSGSELSFVRKRSSDPHLHTLLEEGAP